MSRLEVRKIDTNYTLLMVLVKEGVGCLMSSSFVPFDDGRHEKIKISFRQSVSPSSAPSLGHFPSSREATMDFGSMLSKLKRDAQVASSAPVPKRARHDEQQQQSRRRYPSTPIQTVYLVCPPRVQTGGPEAMHQLCHALNTNPSFDGAAKMLYLREDDRVGVRHAKGVQRLPVYERYDAPAAEGMPGEFDNEGGDDDASTKSPEKEGDGKMPYSSELVIWPECWTNLIDCAGIQKFSSSMKKNVSHQTAIWWLSVDNNNGKYKDWGRDDILHLYQSEYAKKHLRKKGAKHIVQMTEYIPDRSTSIDAAVAQAASASRDLQVLYNPLKGIHYTDEIKRRSGRGKDAIQFTPIGGGMDGRSRISPEEVIQMLRRARIYIDFGPHPGMDRLPREAALAGCFVITNAEGAAQYEEDVPIPAEYKIRKFDVDRIHRLLRSCLDDESKVKDFDKYRAWIDGQAKRMDGCVRDFIDEIDSKRRK